jgi:hypothetical protein
MSSTTPSKQSARFISKLRKKSEEFQAVFESEAEARRKYVEHDAALGVGLIGGLIASTILPLSRDAGHDAGLRAESALTKCSEEMKDFKGPDKDNLVALCLSSRNYGLDKGISEALSSGHVAFGSLVLAIVSLLIVRRIFRRG